jgi:elongation factor 1-beta
MSVINVSFDLSTPKGLAALDKYLESRSYFCGFSLTQTDVNVFNALPKSVDAAKYPNIARYAAHIDAVKADATPCCAMCHVITVGGASTCGGAAAGAGAPKKAAKAADSDDDESDDDLFGDSDDEGDAKAKAKAKAAAAAKAKAAAAAQKKKDKPKKVEKTQCIWEVKPADSETSLDDMEAAIRAIQKDGLVWGEAFDRQDVAFGIQKLVINCIVQDDLVTMGDIEEPIEAMEDLVQSIDMVAMQKL